MKSVFAGRTAFFLSESTAPRVSFGEDCEPGLKTFVLKKVNTLCGAGGGAAGEATFPVAQPLSFRRSALPELLQHEDAFLVSLKSDGARAMLLLTRDWAGTPISVIVTRDLRVSHVEVWAPDPFFDDTLLDAEVVVETGKDGEAAQVFLVFDAFVVEGKSLLLDTYDRRVAIVSSVVAETLAISGSDEELLELHRVHIPSHVGLALRAKRVDRMASVAETWRSRTTTPHANDGLIFTSNTTHFGGAKVLKWKPCPTVDVFVKRNVANAVFAANAKRIEKLVVERKAYEVDLRKNELVDSHFAKPSSENVIVAECAIDVNEGLGRITLSPIRLRPDKKTPNSIFVLKETVLNYIENVTVAEFVVERHRHTQSSAQTVKKRR